MPVLDCPIAKEDWAQVVKQRNCFAGPSAERPAQKTIADAGWEPAIQKIVEFQHLGDNWDGFGAVAPSRELLDSAIGLAYLFCETGVVPPQAVVPGVDGSVNLEWQDPDGTFAEVEIERPLHAEVMVIEPGEPPRFWVLPTG